MDVDRVVGQIVDLVEEHYVFPEIGERIGRLLRQRLEAGAYAGLSPEELSAQVTTDLQSVNGDGHTRLRYHADALPEDHGDAAADAVRRREFAAEWAGGVAQVRRLEDNVGYLELAPLLFAPGDAGPAVGAAMTVLADTTALIIDVRQCLGGDPRTVALICGYLLDDEAVLVNSLRDRQGDLVQFWTSPAVPGRRYGSERPVAVLTSDVTWSAAEELAYDLQQLGRVRVVGERTLGGAHNRRTFKVDPHLEATISTSAAVNPMTGSNWEGVGVQPDIVVSSDDALETAHRLLRGR
ncbi:S41 family peptidase [Cryptosporangium minutisporangium]|uniref:S41 family peptidase n=1 Tax=Cryptosporangium minutisporangium TaxID=113569 RepID=A0ABP6SP46_9ACTN